MQQRKKGGSAATGAAVIFDFDGTIAESLPAVIQVYEQLTKRPEKYTAEQVEAFRDLSIPELVKALGVPRWKAPLLLLRGRKMIRGGGCYWCLEAFYQRIRGIEQVVSGYSGGHVDHPTAQGVYQGDTGHAEVVQLTFDPSEISYRDILEIFFVMHDPTTLNRQGHDIGDEYRSVIFYHDEEQQRIAEDMITSFAPTLYTDPIVTQLVPFEKFWPADESMQDYYNRNPNAGYCIVVIDPKIQKLRQKFAARFKEA